jgi:hypothetical protein
LYFVAKGGVERYQDLARKASQPFTATGITVLEQSAGLVPSGSVREVAFVTTQESLSAITAGTDPAFSELREVPGASEVTILDARHPLFGLLSERRKAERQDWPLGLAALDAMDHPNPRIAMLARDCWRRWVDEIQTINVVAARHLLRSDEKPGVDGGHGGGP